MKIKELITLLKVIQKLDLSERPKEIELNGINEFEKLLQKAKERDY